MRRGWVLTISALALGLSWLALDDITTGREPSFFLEWLLVAASLAWFGALGVRACCRVVSGSYPKTEG